jgi:hypothetical protein
MQNVFHRYVDQITTATKTLFNVKQTQLKANNLFLASNISNRAAQLRTQANNAQAARLISASGDSNSNTGLIKRTRPF